MTELLERIKQTGNPLVEGETVTFVWQGEDAPQLIGDFTAWEYGSPLDLEQVAPGLWVRALSFPPDAYLEYAFWRGGERLADPLSPHVTSDGLGHDNHFFYMPAAGPTPLTRRRRGVPHGTLTRHLVENDFLLAGKTRPVHLYRPPGDGPWPLLVVLDGQDYRRQARLTNIVDNLIAAGRISPLALALVYHGGSARGVEYACSEMTMGLLLEEVLPLARRVLDLVDVAEVPGAYGVLGASMGGLMALYAGLRAPHVFGRVLSQSGAFTLDEYDTVVWDLIRHGPVQPLRIWLDAGRYEWLLEPNQRMQALLQERGYDVAYHQFNAGHNYPAWRNDVATGLEFLFPAESRPG